MKHFWVYGYIYEKDIQAKNSPSKKPPPRDTRRLSTAACPGPRQASESQPGQPRHRGTWRRTSANHGKNVGKSMVNGGFY